MPTDGHNSTPRTRISLGLAQPAARRGLIFRAGADASGPGSIARIDQSSEDDQADSSGGKLAAGKSTSGDEIEKVQDWYIPEGNPAGARIYPDDSIPDDTVITHATNLEQMLRTRRVSASISRDFRLPYNGLLFKGHIQDTVDGIMYMLRRVSKRLPSLHVLGLPEDIKRVLLDERLAPAGGLIVVAGAHGQGKSTTAASLVVARVTSNAGFCLTVEDPPEFDLHGDHVAVGGKRGKIIQVPAETDHFSSALRDAMRCYPSAKRGSMLFIGEVRDNDTATQTLKAANNGQLVITTVHASDPISALDRILAFARSDMGDSQARSMLAHALRASVYQSLDDKRLKITALFSTSASSSVGSTINSGNLRTLSTEMERQQILIGRGELAKHLGLGLSSAL